MLLRSMFEGNELSGTLGEYPLTAENLFRVGLALCTYLVIEREKEKPTLGLDILNFATIALAVGFMAGGGDVFIGEGDLKVLYRVKEKHTLIFEGITDLELKKVESILFSRYNIPKKRGEEVGKLWIEGRKL
ncbi:hypothetical protein [Thermocrinis sp.]